MALSTFWIADSGGSKTEWVLCENNKVVQRHITAGLHPRYLAQHTDDDRQFLRELLNPGGRPIFFYGAGCARESAVKLMEEALTQLGFSEIHVLPDSLGACRALCGNHSGLVAILGTGSILLDYNGESIERRFGGFGPLIGDEGSGLHFARLVVRDYLAGKLLPERSESVRQLIGTTDEVLSQLAGSEAVQWLAGIGKKLATVQLDDYHLENLLQWIESWRISIGNGKALEVIGSYGAAQQGNLRKLLKQYDIELGKVLETPMDGLINYHFKMNGNSD